MNFCAPHSAHLVAALEALGLGAFVDVDDLGLVERHVLDSYFNGVTIDNFDPYGLAAWHLHAAVLAYFGSEAIELTLTSDLGYEQCPACFLDDHCPSRCGDHRRLLETLARKQLAHWRELSA